MQNFWLCVHHVFSETEVFTRTPFNHMRRQGPRAAGEADQWYLPPKAERMVDTAFIT